jgi:putative heme-binding domain-containing protein
MNPSSLANLGLATTILFLSSLCPAQDRLQLGQDEVVVLMGGTNMVRLQQTGHFESILTHAFAAQRPKFRDLAWEADTVFRQGSVIERWRKDGFGSRDDQLKRVDASIIIAQFGQLESMAGPTGLDRFTKAYEELIDSFLKQTRRIVLVTPTPFEKPANPLAPDLSLHNANLALYIKSIKTIVADRKLILVDLYSNSKPGLTRNGMHIKPSAQPAIAREFARQLGIPITEEKQLARLLPAVIEKHRLWYDYWRPANWKLLYGDDARRQFTRGGDNYIPFKEEWKKLLPLIEQAEERAWRIASGGDDPGPQRPSPEVLHGDKEANIKEELAAFTVPDGFQVNLFASEKEGLTSPLAIRWDPAGRMYVTVTTTYPHVFPGDLPNDKIICLEDTDHDGRADKSHVFADGLNIPTGLEWGEGGLYVGQNTELLFLEDTDGDGRADQRRVLLGGFGNGDSHQTINSFIWSPGGELYFGQGDGCESRVETPWGASNLFQAGFYRYRPRRQQLHPLLNDFMGPGNPWGVAFDRWGQIFSIDGAGGVTYLSPGQIPSTHRLRLRTIGRPGGYCGISYLDGRHFPKSMHGDFVIGDFKSNRIKRFSVRNDGAGFSLQWKDHLLQSRHRNFRPVDVKMGPDGAIYVVDWYNPITCHQDDAYRHPTRDKAHGRIWRISTTAPSIKPANLSQAKLPDLLDALKAPEHWTRYQAKRTLTTRNRTTVSKALDRWIQSLDPKDPEHEHHLYEALGAYATIEVVQPALLARLLQAQDPNARAYAARITGRWHDRLDEPLELLTPRVIDEHPRVRMEAVLACAAIASPRSIEVAATVIDKPIDNSLQYVFKQAVHQLQPYWMPAFQEGTVSFAKPSHLAAVLNETGGREVLSSLQRLLNSQELKPATKSSAIATILTVGGPQELATYGLDPKRFTSDGQYDASAHADALAKLIEVARFREVKPAGNLAETLRPLIEGPHRNLQASALTLAGLLNVDKLATSVLNVAKNEKLPVSVRAAALAAMVEMKLPAGPNLLALYSSKPNPAGLRAAAIKALTLVDMPSASQQAVDLFSEPNLTTVDTNQIMTAFLTRSGGAQALATALESRTLKAANARQLLTSLFATGNSDQVLLGALNRSLGSFRKTPDYSKGYVEQLVNKSHQQGNAERGKLLFNTVACASCHKVGGTGGKIGPDLSAIGTTLSAERITEELLWPNRQVKEGYSVVRVITAEGKIHQGYQRRTQESEAAGNLVLQDPATKKLVTIKKQNIDQRQTTGSIMPGKLTAVLSEAQLLDLIQYLSELGKIK